MRITLASGVSSVALMNVIDPLMTLTSSSAIFALKTILGPEGTSARNILAIQYCLIFIHLVNSVQHQLAFHRARRSDEYRDSRIVLPELLFRQKNLA